MTAAFFLRELRRQAPVGLALVALGLLLIVSVGLFETGQLGYSVVPLVMGVLAPYLLGVASVAPDVESGAEAFLTRLPARRAGLFLARVGAALTWTGVVLAATPLAQLLAGDGLPVTQEEWPLLAGIGLTAGVLASATLRPTLLAFALGPIALAPWWAWTLLAKQLRSTIHDEPGGAAVLALLAPALVAAWVYLRGDIHGPARRPVSLAMGLLAGVTLLASGGTTAAWGVGRSLVLHERVVQTVLPADESGTALGLSRHSRWGRELVFHYFEIDHWQLHRIGERGHEVVPLPPAAYAELSADGRRILRVVPSGSASRLELHDADGALVLSVDPGKEVWEPIITRDVLLGDEPGVVWVGDVPWVELDGVWVEVGRAGRRVGGWDQTSQAASGGRVLQERGEQLLLLDLTRPDEPARSLERVPGAKAATLVAGGELLVELVHVPGEVSELRWRGLTDPALSGSVRIGVTGRPEWPDQPLDEVRVAARPGSGWLAFSAGPIHTPRGVVWDAPPVRVDLTGGRARPCGRPGSWKLLPDGRLMGWDGRSAWVESSVEGPVCDVPLSWVPLLAAHTPTGQGGVTLPSAWAPLWEGWDERR